MMNKTQNTPQQIQNGKLEDAVYQGNIGKLMNLAVDPVKILMNAVLMTLLFAIYQIRTQ
jgi:hypothetical protein